MLDKINEIIASTLPTQNQPVQPEPVEVVQQNPSNPIEKQDNSQATNFRQLRERVEAAEKRNRELEYMVSQNLAQKSQTKVEIEPEDTDIQDDSYIEGRDLKKHIRNLRKDNERTKKEFTDYVARTTIDRLRDKNPDFDDVVNEENLNKLALKKPHIFRSIIANQDTYDRGMSAYDLIKSSGIVIEASPTDRKLEENRTKPRSVSNASPQPSESPLTKIEGYGRRVLTEERKAEIRKQSEESRRYYS